MANVLSAEQVLIKFTFQIELEFGKCWFFRRGETRVATEKPLGAGMRTNNKLDQHMTQVQKSNEGTLVGGKCSRYFAMYPCFPLYLSIGVVNLSQAFCPSTTEAYPGFFSMKWPGDHSGIAQ